MSLSVKFIALCAILKFFSVAAQSIDEKIVAISSKVTIADAHNIMILKNVSSLINNVEEHKFEFGNHAEDLMDKIDRIIVKLDEHSEELGVIKSWVNLINTNLNGMAGGSYAPTNSPTARPSTATMVRNDGDAVVLEYIHITTEYDLSFYTENSGCSVAPNAFIGNLTWHTDQYHHFQFNHAISEGEMTCWFTNVDGTYYQGPYDMNGIGYVGDNPQGIVNICCGCKSGYSPCSGVINVVGHW